MSLYNMINGINPATFFILPMIAERHPESYPRFRDCFVGELSNSTETNEFNIPLKELSKSKTISLYTRTGGGNRDDYFAEINDVRSIPGFIKDYDDDFDSTYMTFLFAVPKEFEHDFDLIMEGRIKEISENYKARLYRVFPKLKETFDQIFIETKENIN